MRATDVDPTRFAAAKEAAKAFVQDQPKDVRIAIVSFAGTASVVQAPTHNRDDLVAAIDRLELQRTPRSAAPSSCRSRRCSRTTGSTSSRSCSAPGRRPSGRFGPLDKDERRARPRRRRRRSTPVQPGSHPSAAIILLTDGRRTTGPDPLDAARMAAERGVRVYTVGFGTKEGSSVAIDGWSIYMRFDEEALRAIADITRAEYFHAGSAADLKKVYDTLNAKFVLERKEIEITALVAAAAAVLAVARRRAVDPLVPAQRLRDESLSIMPAHRRQKSPARRCQCSP